MEIDKNVERPKKWANTKYPFSEMEIGDSFFLEMENAPEGVHTRAHLLNIKVSYRKWEQDGVKGYRIWRVS